MDHRISRLAFLKRIWVGISAAILAACKPEQEPAPTGTPTPDNTFTPQPTNTTIATKTMTPTKVIDTSPTLACVQLISPEDNQELPSSGKFRFSWDVIQSAKAYRILLVLPNKAILALATTTNNFRDQYLDPLSGGEYEWYVEALDIEENVICISDRNKFSKQALPNNLDQSGSGNSGSPESPSPTLKPPQTENT